MRQARATVTALVLSAVCTGCGGWTGGGFRADGPEMPRIREVLALRQGIVVADVGAGEGQLTFALAREVGPSGHVISTEIDPERLRALRESVAAARLGNVTVVEGFAGETGLSSACCDAIVLRRVYHHVSDPPGINASLWRALRPGGFLVVIDFPSPMFLGRGSFGVPAQTVIREVRSAGLELVRLIEDWPGRGPLPSYCAVFRKSP